MGVSEIAGIPLTDLEDPIYNALSKYENNTDKRVRFQPADASLLELAHDKPYAGRSKTVVRYLNKPVADLIIVAFAPYDGTGAESIHHKLTHTNTGSYPRHPRVIPRPKDCHSEVHLTIASQFVGSPRQDARMYAGSLDLLGLEQDDVVKIGELGQPRQDYEQLMSGVHRLGKPTTTLTVGDHYNSATANDVGERFGDPHAVYNPFPNMLQVCGFIGVGTPEHAEMFRLLQDS